jgi:NAD(P)-dependent dehydrogenase (short-subunit alcohol dehydrogenase family)
MPGKKVWFITGSAGGFASVWTHAALSRGDKVVAADRNFDALQGLVDTFGDAVLPLQLDVTDRAAVFRAMEEAHGHFGRLDVVLHAAGYGLLAAVEEADVDQVRANFETNFFGTLSVIQAAIPILRAQGGGHILPVSSIGGVVTFPIMGLYQATKFAVEGLAETLATEVAEFGIKVTIIEPSAFATPFVSASTNIQTMPEYDGLRASLYDIFTPEKFGNPAATGDAILKVVDAPNPPLRLILGTVPLPLFRKAYEERLATWEAWSDVSNAAQGQPVA